LTVLVMAPLARPGFVLSYDMVTVPRQRLVPDALGLGSALPRAVPQDAVLALLTSVVPGAAVYRVVLIGLVFGAALGAGRLLPHAAPAVQAVAAAAYGWNTYVAERLAIGHWTLLVSYAVLPWLLRQALAVRDGRPEALPRALLLVAVASITPTGGVLASALLVLVVLLPQQKPHPAGLGARRTLSVAGCLAFQLPWIVPGLLTPTPLTSDPAGVEAFSARPDSPLGLVGSVLTLGGIWNAEVVPESRGLVSAAIVTLAWALLALIGVRDVTRLVGRAGAIAMASLAAAGVLLSLAGGYGTGLAWAVEHVPAAGLLRDGHKFLAWYALLLAPAAALGAARVASAVARRANEALAGTAVAAVAAVLPMAALPDLAWGVAGRIEPVTYPASWPEVRRALSARPDVGALVVLPFQPFRSFAWNDHRTVLDPLPRYVGVETVVPDSLTVDGKRLAGEDPRAAAVDEALAGREPLRELLAVGVGWVVVEHGTPGAVPEGLLNDLDPVLVNGEVDLYRVPGVPLEWNDVPPTVPVIGVDLLAVGGVAGCCVATALVRPKASVPDTVPPPEHP
jgi:hypothetical protein